MIAQKAVLVCLEDKKWVCCRCVFADCVHGYLPAVLGCDRSSVLRYTEYRRGNGFLEHIQRLNCRIFPQVQAAEITHIG